MPAGPECITPHIRFLFIAPRFRLERPKHPASRRRTCPLANLRLYIVPDRKVVFSEFPTVLTRLQLCSRDAELEISGSLDAPNPAGVALLKHGFNDESIGAGQLLRGVLLPTAVAAAMLLLF